MDIERLLSSYFCTQYKINTDKSYKIEWVDARELLVANRIDLVIKYKYTEYYDKGYDLSYVRKVYAAQIGAHTIYTYTEGGQENTKNSIEAYLQVFDRMIESIRDNGMDAEKSVIPVGAGNAIMDGSHRVAISAYFGKQVPIVRFPHLEAHNDADFFRSRNLPEAYLDYIVTEYCKLRSDTFVACIWPRAKNPIKRQQMENILATQTKVVYQKDIKLSFNAMRNLFIQVYQYFDWLGGLENHFEGGTHYSNLCYAFGGNVRIYVLDGGSLDEMNVVKQQIRALFNIGNCSIHMTDNQREAIQIANLLFNRNSLHHLSHATPDRFIDFNRSIQQFKDCLINNRLSSDNYLIDASSVLAAYGIRDAADIDYMTIEQNNSLLLHSEFDNHQDYIDYYGVGVSDLVLNPEHHFFYNETKFASLAIVRRMKENRQEEKDLRDVAMIDKLLHTKPFFLFEGVRQLYMAARRHYLRKRWARIVKKQNQARN